MRLRAVCGTGLLTGALLWGLPVADAPTARADTAGTASGDECMVGAERWVADRPLAYAQLGIDRAHQISTGEGVLVAIVDSGVDSSNAHLSDATRSGENIAGSGAATEDEDGHGTALAGQIAARAVDGSGVLGIAPDAEILPVKVYNTTEASRNDDAVEPNLPMISEGIDWAADQGAQVIVVALSSAENNSAVATAVQRATQQGSLVVASSGNRATAAENEQGDGVRYPAGYQQVLGVAAATDDGAMSEAAFHGTQVDLAAPAQNVATTYFGDGDCVISQDAPSTSFATGYVAGIAALVAAAHPDEDPLMWKWRLEATGLRANPSQRSDELGWGVVSAYDALTVTPSAQLLGPALPGQAPAEAGAQVGRVPPSPDEDPLAVRAQFGLWATGLGVFGVAVLWLVRRRIDAARS
ncbi:MAG: S8 family serine peptidase [Micrococcaceae bacterium]